MKRYTTHFSILILSIFSALVFSCAKEEEQFNNQDNNPTSQLFSFTLSKRDYVMDASLDIIMEGIHGLEYFKVSGEAWEQGLNTLDFTNDAILTVQEKNSAEKAVLNAENPYNFVSGKDYEITAEYVYKGYKETASLNLKCRKLYDITSDNTNISKILPAGLKFPAHKIWFKAITEEDGKESTFYGDSENITVYCGMSEDMLTLYSGNLSDLVISDDSAYIRIYPKSNLTTQEFDTISYYENTFEVNPLSSMQFSEIIINPDTKFTQQKIGSTITFSDLGKNIDLQFRYNSRTAGLWNIIDDAGIINAGVTIDIYQNQELSGEPLASFTKNEGSWLVTGNNNDKCWVKVSAIIDGEKYTNSIENSSGSKITNHYIVLKAE